MIVEGQKEEEEENDDYLELIRSDGCVWGNWEEVRMSQQEIVLPCHSVLENSDISNAFQWHGDGVEIGALAALEDLLENTSTSTIQRLLSCYLSEKSFSMNQVSRDGGALKSMVIVEDIAAYQFLLQLCTLFPAALRPKPRLRCFSFHSSNLRLLWFLKSKIHQEFTKRQETNAVSGEWLPFGDSRKREPFEHQSECLELMQDAFDNGTRSHFIYIRVGGGKTFISMSYLQWLQTKDLLPPYVVFALPPSAIEGVLTEILCFYPRVNLVCENTSQKPQYWFQDKEKKKLRKLLKKEVQKKKCKREG